MLCECWDTTHPLAGDQPGGGGTDIASLGGSGKGNSSISVAGVEETRGECKRGEEIHREDNRVEGREERQ